MLKFSHWRYPGTALLAGLLSAALPGGSFAAGLDRDGLISLKSRQIEIAWQSTLPASQIMQYKSYHLLDGRIYAMGTDGTVAAVRADNGEVSWVRALADEGDELFAPGSYHSPQGNAVAFTRLHNVLLADPKTGATTRVLQSGEPPAGPAAFSPDRVYLAHAGSSLSAYRLKDNYIHWRASFVETLSMPPLYVPSLDIVVATDDVGLVAGLRNIDRTNERTLFKLNLRSRPRGWMASEGAMLYLSTDNQLLHAIAMGATGKEKKYGEVSWQYRLAKPPEGGPILSEAAIYQATVDGGLHRLAKFPGEFKAWYAPNAKRFLAEWPKGVVVLTTDGKLGLIRENPANPEILADVGGFSAGISNVFNDAIYLTRSDGKICCLRPVDAAPLKLASFVPPPNPTSAPAKEKERETFIERIRREAGERKAKRNRTAVEEIKVPAASQPQPAVTANQPATPAPPADPLRSNIPVVPNTPVVK